MTLDIPSDKWGLWQQSHHGQHFRTLLLDPPWPSGKPRTPKRDNWMRTNMKPRYGTMTAKQLLDLPIGVLAADDAVLVTWATWMHLDLAMKCIEAWGFRYCAGFPWLKVVKGHADMFGVNPIYGPGVWVQGCTEPVLIARRGRPFGSLGNPRPARKGLIVAPRQEHSRKPDELQDWIDDKFPGPKIELFARRTRAGWYSWGNQL